MNRPNYCTQNEGDCKTCSLANDGRDCRQNPIRYYTLAEITACLATTERTARELLNSAGADPKLDVRAVNPDEVIPWDWLVEYLALRAGCSWHKLDELLR